MPDAGVVSPWTKQHLSFHANPLRHFGSDTLGQCIQLGVASYDPNVKVIGSVAPIAWSALVAEVSMVTLTL